MPDSIPKAAADLRDTELQTAALLEDLGRMRGSRCERCGAALCGHEALMNLVAGYKGSPRCLSCLSQAMGQGRKELRDYLLGYVMSRPCRQAAWLWANEQENAEPGALPECLWPPGDVQRTENGHEQAAMTTTDDSGANPAFDDHWDAGDMGCGELVMGLRMRLQSLAPGQVLKLTAADPGVAEDLPAWCRMTGHKLLVANHPNYWIQRKEN